MSSLNKNTKLYKKKKLKINFWKTYLGDPKSLEGTEVTQPAINKVLECVRFIINIYH